MFRFAKNILLIFVLISAYQNLNAQSVADVLLLEAAAEGDGHAAILALRIGADVNCKTEDLVTPLMYASESGNINLVKYLLEKGANTNDINYFGSTALSTAVRFGHTDICDLLLGYSPKLAQIDSNGKGLLMHACIYGYWDIAELLLINGVPMIPYTDGTTELHLAANDGDTALIRILLRYNAVLEATDTSGYTPLHMAAQNGHLPAVQLLCSLGANVNAVSKNGSTPLLLAVLGEHLTVAEYLLQNKANVTTEHNIGNSPMYIAQVKGNKDIENLLKQNGVKGTGFPFFTSWTIGPAMNFSRNDFLLGVTAGIFEQKLRLRGEVGYWIRPYRARVLYPIDLVTYWQMRELKQEVYTSLKYQLKITERSGTLHSLTFGGYASFTWGNFKGSLYKPENTFHIAPVIGIASQKRYFYSSIEYTYIDYHTSYSTNDSPHFVQLKLLVQIPRTHTLTEKRIYNWL